MHSFVHFFLSGFISEIIHSFMSFIHWFIHFSSVHFISVHFICSFVRSLIRLFIQEFMHSFIRSFVHSSFVSTNSTQLASSQLNSINSTYPIHSFHSFCRLRSFPFMAFTFFVMPFISFHYIMHWYFCILWRIHWFIDWFIHSTHFLWFHFCSLWCSLTAMKQMKGKKMEQPFAHEVDHLESSKCHCSSGHRFLPDCFFETPRHSRASAIRYGENGGRHHGCGFSPCFLFPGSSSFSFFSFFFYHPLCGNPFWNTPFHILFASLLSFHVSSVFLSPSFLLHILGPNVLLSPCLGGFPRSPFWSSPSVFHLFSVLALCTSACPYFLSMSSSVSLPFSFASSCQNLVAAFKRHLWAELPLKVTCSYTF